MMRGNSKNNLRSPTVSTADLDTLEAQITAVEDDLDNLVRYISLKVEEYDTTASVGDGGAYFACIPEEFNGFSLVSARASYGNAKGSAGTTDIQLAKISGSNHATVVDMLSTLITLGDEWHVADGVIKSDGSEVLATGDIIRVDVDAVRTDSEGLFVTIGLKG